MGREGCRAHSCGVGGDGGGASGGGGGGYSQRAYRRVGYNVDYVARAGLRAGN